MHGPCDALIPCEGRTTVRPFFVAVPLADGTPLPAPRSVRFPATLPAPLRDAYARFPPDVDLHDLEGGWTFLSESEMARRSEKSGRRSVDLAVQYRGMGRVRVLALDEEGQVFEDDDGGANPYERRDNMQRRDAETPAGRSSFAEWWAGRKRGGAA